MPRCCTSHESWPQIAEHLARAFPQESAADIYDEVQRARSAVQRFDLEAADELDVGERIARHQMMLRAGDIVDNSRLDPEVHSVRRSNSPSRHFIDLS